MRATNSYKNIHLLSKFVQLPRIEERNKKKKNIKNKQERQIVNNSRQTVTGKNLLRQNILCQTGHGQNISKEIEQLGQ